MPRTRPDPGPRSAERTSRTAAPAAGANARRRRRDRRTTITLFLLPALVLFILLVLVPIGLAMYASLFRWNGLGGAPTDFVGTGNFRLLLDDEVFLGDLWRGLLLVALSITIQLPMALGIALLLNRRLR
ncbi:MAG: hypothetical protein ACRDOO_14425, partial [Actinomadura sp.]